MTTELEDIGDVQRFSLVAYCNMHSICCCDFVLEMCLESWLRARASVLSSEGCRFDSPGLHVNVSLGKILNPKLLLMCWLAPCMVHVGCYGKDCLLNALKWSVSYT